jgi:hypothetical protein
VEEFRDNAEFHKRYRFTKEDILVILHRIEDEIAPNSNRNVAVAPINRLLLTV